MGKFKFDRSFRLSSPVMRGKDVAQLQRVLRGSNAFRKNFRPGRIDGEYGPHTAAAVRRAKHFLGFPSRKVDRIAGSTFIDLLRGDRKLPRLYRIRHRRRLAAKRDRLMLRERALGFAMNKVGLAEKPEGSNRNWLVTWWYGSATASAPWCAISVSHSYMAAGSKAFRKGVDYAYVPFLEHGAAGGNERLMRIGKNDVKPGDIVTFNFDGGVADHVGIFVGWVSKRNGVFECVEGNTDTQGGAEGGEQMVRERSVRLVSQFIRVLG